jgi:hypothetical protein
MAKLTCKQKEEKVNSAVDPDSEPLIRIQRIWLSRLEKTLQFRNVEYLQTELKYCAILEGHFSFV